jgi:hypothetical protein
MRRLVFGLLFALCGARYAAAQATVADIAILTPAVPVSLGIENHPAGWLATYTFGANELLRPIDDEHARRLNLLRRTDLYSPADRLGHALEDAVRQSGRAVITVAVTRSGKGPPGALKFDELPDHPAARALLDVTLRSLNVWRSRVGDPYYPGWVASYRVIGVRGELIQPSRVLVMGVREFDADSCGKPSHGVGTVVCFPLMAECTFEDIAEIERTDPRIWGCFDKSFDELAKTITSGLPKL